MLLLAVGRIFNSDFGLFYQVPLGSGLLYNTTQTIDTYVYRSLLELNNVGMSSAASVFQAVIGFLLVILSNAFVRLVDKDNALF
jgi:putative aldouronate transport system permease protein